MGRVIEHKLYRVLDSGFRVLCLCALLAVCFLLSLINPLWAQSTSANLPVYEGVSVDGAENSFAFLIFNNEYTKNISPIIDVDENKKGMLALLSGLAFPAENIFVLENPSNSDLEDEIYEFSRKLSPKTDLLVYYNGHNVSFADTPENEILLTSFKLPRSNDLFLLERRVSRNIMSLEDIIAEFTPKRIGQVTVFFDACNQHFITPADDAEHWEVFSRTPCTPAKVSGVDVFYAGTQSGKGSLVNALTAVMSKNPTIDLLSLERELLDYKAIGAADQISTQKKPVFVAGVRAGDPANQCLRKSMVDGNLTCNAVPTTPVDEVPAATGVKTNSSTSVDTVKKAPKKGAEMRNAWAAAKRSSTCKPYQDFVEKYPNAIFIMKAKRAISNLCVPVPTKKVAKTDTVKELPKKKAEITETAKITAAVEPEPTKTPQTTPEPEETILPATCEATSNAASPFKLTRIGRREMQQQLNRLGCNVGGADGIWGRNSQAGFDRLNTLIVFDNNLSKPNCDNLKQLKALPSKRICPLICGRGFKKVNGKCVAIKPAVTATGTTKPAVTATITTKSTESDKNTTKIDTLRKRARDFLKKAAEHVEAEPVNGTCPKTQVFRNGRCVYKVFSKN